MTKNPTKKQYILEAIQLYHELGTSFEPKNIISDTKYAKTTVSGVLRQLKNLGVIRITSFHNYEVVDPDLLKAMIETEKIPCLESTWVCNNEKSYEELNSMVNSLFDYIEKVEAERDEWKERAERSEAFYGDLKYKYDKFFQGRDITPIVKNGKEQSNGTKEEETKDQIQ